jgi:hypothetical protein
VKTASDSRMSRKVIACYTEPPVNAEVNNSRKGFIITENDAVIRLSCIVTDNGFSLQCSGHVQTCFAKSQSKVKTMLNLEYLC